jgi:hypothetical protein
VARTEDCCCPQTVLTNTEELESSHKKFMLASLPDSKVVIEAGFNFSGFFHRLPNNYGG